MQNPQYQEDYFVYTTGVGLETSFVPLDGGDSGEATIQVEADSYFKAIKAVYHCYTATSITDEDAASASVTFANLILPPITVDMIDDSSGRILSNERVFVNNAFGNRGGLPIIFSTPRIFRARSIIRFRATNERAAGAGDPLQIVLSLVGVKGYKAT